MPVSKTTILLLFCAALATVCGFLGFTLRASNIEGNGGFLWNIANDLYLTARLFVLEGPRRLPDAESIVASDVLLNIARFLAPASLGGAIVSAALSFCAPQVQRLKASFARSHVIVAGNGNLAHQFFRYFSTGRSIAISISNTNTDPDLPKTTPTSLGLVFDGAMTNTDQWNSISYQKANTILIADNDDGKNLEAARTLVNLGWVGGSAQTKIYCHINNTELRDELVTQTEIFGTLGSVRVEPFSIAELAARSFFHSRNFFWDASNRNHKRIHWLVFGGGESVLTFLRHFLTICPHPDFDEPLITLVTDPNTDDLKPLQRLAHRGAKHFEINRIGFDEFEKKLKPENRPTNFDAPVTAILVNANAKKSTIELALALRRASFRDVQLKAPIFFSGDDVGQWSSGDFGRLSHYLDDEISPIASLVDLCTTEILSGLSDRAAMAIHSNYLASIQIRDSAKTPSHKSWDQLDENFRRSNRRAADHAKTKCESLGILGSQPVTKFAAKLSVEDLETRIEALAKSEHDSWMTDRLLHGWDYAEKRDDDRWLHSDLVPYTTLEETSKEKDREQIRELFRRSRKFANGTAAGRSIRVGLIGRNHISTSEALSIHSSLVDRVFPELCMDYKNCHFQFFTPLAPGTDLVSAQTMRLFFAKRKEKHKLYVIESAPLSALVECYQQNRQANNCWGLGPEMQPASSGLSMDILDCLKMFAGSNETINVLAKNGLTFEELLETNADYFSSKMDVLIAYKGLSPPNGPFGTAETIVRAEANGLDVRLV